MPTQSIWWVFENLKFVVKQCYQTNFAKTKIDGEYENWKIRVEILHSVWKSLKMSNLNVWVWFSDFLDFFGSDFLHYQLSTKIGLKLCDKSKKLSQNVRKKRRQMRMKRFISSANFSRIFAQWVLSEKLRVKSIFPCSRQEGNSL